MQLITRCVPTWRLLLLFLSLLNLCLVSYICISSSSVSSSSSSVITTSAASAIKSFFESIDRSHHSNANSQIPSPERAASNVTVGRTTESRIAVCLVGGGRRFELTGPSILEMILKANENADLFLHSPLDRNAYKFSLLKDAPRIAAVKIFRQEPIPETESHYRLLTAQNSPNGIQGLLQYFNLVEGCLQLINEHQTRHNFTYDWIVRTRVDTYWSGPLRPNHFIPGAYLVPTGSSYLGLNDRLGIGDFNTSAVALSRISLIPQLDEAGYRKLTSESAFKAQLTVQNVSYARSPMPFCVVTDHKYKFPPHSFGVPVAAMSTPGPLNGAKCRPCLPACAGICVARVMIRLFKFWGWTEWHRNGLELCDAHAEWEMGWENIFDKVAGTKLAAQRKRVQALKLDECIYDFQNMRKRADHWEAPPAPEICGLLSNLPKP